MSARDIRYGRQAGRWAEHAPGTMLSELRELQAQREADGSRAEAVDLDGLFHPAVVAKARAHDQQCRGKHKNGECPAVPEPADIAEVWSGRARMAAARLAAGQPLDDVDHEALARAGRKTA